jgi:hypothetical protein
MEREGISMIRKEISVLCLLILLSVSCTRKDSTEEQLKREIHAWWGMAEIDEVVIEDYLSEDTVMIVLSRLVVFGDTTVRMEYEFKKQKREWRVSKGPVDERAKRFCIEELTKSPVHDARLSVLKANMQNLRVSLEMFGAESGWYPPYIVASDSSISESILLFLGSGMKNPYLQGEPPFIDALGDTSEWFPEYIGKVVYFPWVEGDGTASGFLLKGSSGLGFIDMVFSGGSRRGETPEEEDEGGMEIEFDLLN